MPDLALLLRRLGLAALYLESALGKAGGFSGRSEALALKGFPAPVGRVAQSPRGGRVRCG